MPADLTSYQWHDGTTIIQASSYNAGINYLAGVVNNHAAGTADRHDTTHFGNPTALVGTTARSNAPLGGYNAYQQIDMLVKTFLDIIGNGSDFSTVAIPTTIKAINDTLAAATSTSNKGKIAKWDATTGFLTLPAGSISRSAIVDFGGVASAVPDTTVHWTGGNFTDRSVTNPTIRLLGNGTTTHPAPTVGNERWDVVSVPVGTPTPNYNSTPGTPQPIGTSGGTPSPATATDQVLGYVYTKYGMTGIKDVSDGTNGFIVNVARENFGGVAGGGGGGGAITSAVLGLGTGTPTNAVNILNGSQTGTVNGIDFSAQDASGMNSFKGWGALRTGAATDGSLADTLRDTVGDAAARVYLQSNQAHYSAAVWYPGNLVVNGRSRTVTTEPTPPSVSGLAGPRYLVADLSGVGTGFTFTTPMPAVDTSSATGYKKAIATFYWDGATLHLMADGAYDTSPLATIGSHQVSPTLFTLPATSTLADTLTASDAILNGMSGTLTLTKPSRVRFFAAALYTGAGAPGTYVATFTVYVTGGPQAPGPISAWAQVGAQTGGQPGSVSITTARVQLQAGQYTVSLQGRMTAGGTFATIANGKSLEAEIGN